MASLLLNPGVVVFRDPVGGRSAHPHRWWAERGLLHHEDTVTGAYGSISVKDCLMRLKALHDMVGNSRHDKGFHMPSEVREYQDYIDKMIALCEEAKRQGMPSDPRVTKQKAAEWQNRRFSRLVTVPGLSPATTL